MHNKSHQEEDISQEGSERLSRHPVNKAEQKAVTGNPDINTRASSKSPINTQHLLKKILSKTYYNSTSTTSVAHIRRKDSSSHLSKTRELPSHDTSLNMKKSQKHTQDGLSSKVNKSLRTKTPLPPPRNTKQSSNISGKNQLLSINSPLAPEFHHMAGLSYLSTKSHANLNVSVYISPKDQNNESKF